MAYFNHAFCKSFLAVDASAGDDTLTTALTPGQVALVSDADWKVTDTVTATDLTYIVQGSYRSDILGGNSNHGGYGESIKSKGINPKYLTRIWESSCITASVSSATVTLGSKCHPCGENLMMRVDVKGSPALRFLNRNAYAIGDSMGDAAAGDVPGLCCVAGQTYLDPAVAAAKMGDMIVVDPIVSPFVRERQFGSVAAGIVVTNTKATGGLDGIASLTITAGGSNYTVGDFVTIAAPGSGAVVKVTSVNAGAADGVELVAAGHGYGGVNSAATSSLVVANSGAAGLTITTTVDDNTGSFSIAEVIDGTYVASTDPVADGVSVTFHIEGSYVSTQFGDSSFDTRDFYGKEPVQVRLQMIDETGEPCNDCGTVTHVPAVMEQTTGETVLRHLLLSERYMQNPVHQGNADFNRMREIEGSDAIIAAVDRTALYKTYYVQHSVPRFNNPTSTFDNDQYVYEIFVKCTDTATQGEIEGLLNLLAGANASVVRETSIDQ